MNNIQSIINCTPNVSIFILDKDFNYITFNDAHSQEIFRDHNVYPKIGENILKYFRPKYKETFTKILSGESFSEIDEGDANDFWESNWSPYKNDNGDIIGIVCFAQDITEKVRHQHEIENQASLLEAVIECSNEVSIFALDTDYKLMAFNKTFAKSIFDMHEVEAKVGVSMISMIGYDDIEKSVTLFDQVFAGESTHVVNEWGNITHQIWSDRMSPIYSKDGKIIGLACIGTRIK